MRLLVLDSHPVSYKVPLYRKLSQIPGMEIIVVYCDKFGVEVYTDPQINKILRWDEDFLSGYRYKFLRNYSPRRSPYSFWGEVNLSIFTEVRNGHFDAILINGYARASDWIGFLAAWVNRIPIIFRGEADLIKPTTKMRRVLKRVVLPRLFKRCAAILYSCQSNANYFRYYGVPEEKLFFFPCAVDNDFFQSEAARLKPCREALRKEIGVPAEAVVVLFVGRLTMKKRPMDLLQAFHKGAPDNAWLVFVGDGPERRAMEEYLQRYNLKRVIIVGFKNRSEISEYYAIADMLVVPSDYDRSPKVINEAMNFGIPIIASDKVGTVGDLVKPGENELVFPCGDIDALANHIKRLCTDANLREKMGACALQTVSEWNFDKQVEGVLAALEYALRGRK